MDLVFQIITCKKMNCKYCKGICIRKGFQKNGSQKYACKDCKRHQQETYTYKAYQCTINDQIRKMVKRSSGIRDIAFVLEISTTTVINRIRRIGSEINKPIISEMNQSYEMDEVSTAMRFGENKTDIFVSYIINRRSRQVVSFTVGGRDKITLQKVLNSVLHLFPRRIYTDGWVSYPPLIPERIHRVAKYLINKIERMHLTLRTRLKRMSRNFMCQTRRIDMLEACLNIYFFG
jgi:insertion element IS1 protein InsB